MKKLFAHKISEVANKKAAKDWNPVITAFAVLNQRQENPVRFARRCKAIGNAVK